MAAQARRQADLLRQLDELRTELEALKAAIRARQKAQAELDSLHRERELMRALSAERDPALPLQ
jgi:predicted component of type VI protein secretion system